MDVFEPLGVVTAVPVPRGVTALVASAAEMAVDAGTSAVPVGWPTTVPKLVPAFVPNAPVVGRVREVPKFMFVRVTPVPVAPNGVVARPEGFAPVPLNAGVDKV